jgi:hypothetical protein
VFAYPDCAFFGYLVLNKILNAKKLDSKSSASPIEDSFLQNSLDLLRVIPFPAAVDFSADNAENLRSTSFLVNGDARAHTSDDFDDDGSDDSENEDENNNDELISDKVKRKRERAKRKSGNNADSSSKQRKRQKMSRYEQLVDLTSYKRVFSKVWMTMMSMPGLKISQHKIILKHLPEHVMKHLFKPVLLADYLSTSFSLGGSVSVLALESLFQLIVMHNLDYPKYFAALYKLCTISVFSASTSMRAKFMKLLNRSLTSTNLPHYLVAAFCKRLASLALQVPTPVALFCLAQITKLIRDHPQLIQLIHRTPAAAKTQATAAAADAAIAEFDNTEEDDIELANAITSSLWELAVLKNHYFHSVNSLATTLETTPTSTDNSSKSDLLVIEDFISPTYASLMEVETTSTNSGKKQAKNAALDYNKPKSFFGNTAVGACFGGNL